MALERLSYEKNWTSATDFPTYEPSEAQIREDLQYHPDAIKDFINDELIASLEENGVMEITRTDGTSMKYLRLNEDHVLESSVDGVNWVTVRAYSPTGDAGSSAYGSAKEAGYTGTELEFNEALAKMPYASAYGDAKEAGYTGTELAFNEALAKMPDAIASTSNPNLLDNWYFADPIDQRGGRIPKNTDVGAYADEACATYVGPVKGYPALVPVVTGNYKYTTNDGGATFYIKAEDAVRGYRSTGYAIDRWKIGGASTVISVLSADGITLTRSGTSWVTMYQKFENSSALLGKEVTFSFLTADNRLVTGTLTLPTALDASAATFAADETTKWYLDYYAGTSGFDFRIFQNNTTVFDTITIVAIKLELGSTQTLAHQDANGNWVLNDPPPDKEMELLKCRMSKADSEDTYANVAVPNGTVTYGGKEYRIAPDVANGYYLNLCTSDLPEFKNAYRLIANSRYIVACSSDVQKYYSATGKLLRESAFDNYNTNDGYTYPTVYLNDNIVRFVGSNMILYNIDTGAHTTVSGHGYCGTNDGVTAYSVLSSTTSSQTWTCYPITLNTMTLGSSFNVSVYPVNSSYKASQAYYGRVFTLSIGSNTLQIQITDLSTRAVNSTTITNDAAYANPAIKWVDFDRNEIYFTYKALSSGVVVFARWNFATNVLEHIFEDGASVDYYGHLDPTTALIRKNNYPAKLDLNAKSVIAMSTSTNSSLGSTYKKRMLNGRYVVSTYDYLHMSSSNAGFENPYVLDTDTMEFCHVKNRSKPTANPTTVQFTSCEGVYVARESTSSTYSAVFKTIPDPAGLYADVLYTEVVR